MFGAKNGFHIGLRSIRNSFCTSCDSDEDYTPSLVEQVATGIDAVAILNYVRKLMSLSLIALNLRQMP